MKIVKALFLAGVLIGTPITVALFTGCNDGNTKPEPETQIPDPYEVFTFDGNRAWMNEILVLKIKKGVTFALEIQGRFSSAMNVAIEGSGILQNYLYNTDDWSVKRKINIYIDDFGIDPVLKPDGIHIPLVYIENNTSGIIKSKLIELITILSNQASQSKQFAQGVRQQAEGMILANSKAARQQSALLAKYSARSNIRHV